MESAGFSNIGIVIILSGGEEGAKIILSLSTGKKKHDFLQKSCHKSLFISYLFKYEILFLCFFVLSFCLFFVKYLKDLKSQKSLVVYKF